MATTEEIFKLVTTADLRGSKAYLKALEETTVANKQAQKLNKTAIANAKALTKAQANTTEGLERQAQLWRLVARNVDRTSKEYREAGRELQRVDRLQRRASAGADFRRNALGGALPGGGLLATGSVAGAAGLAVAGGVAAAGVAGVSAFQNAVDLDTQRRQLEIVSRATGDYSAALAVSEDMAQKFNLTQADAAKQLAQVSARLRPMGFNLEEVTAIQQGFNTAARIGGSTAQEASASFLQLSQALGAGALRGEEYNSVAEQAPLVLIEIANVMDQPVGALKKLAAEGQITADIVVTALRNIAKNNEGLLADSFDSPQAKLEAFGVAWKNLSAQFALTFVPTITEGISQVTRLLKSLNDQVGPDTNLGRYLNWLMRGGVIGSIIRQPTQTTSTSVPSSSSSSGGRGATSQQAATSYKQAMAQLVQQDARAERLEQAVATGTEKGTKSGMAGLPSQVIEYITGDPAMSGTRHYDPRGHGGKVHHEHLAFATVQAKEIAKEALKAAGVTIGSEYRRGDPGHHGSNLAIDIPAYPNFSRLGMPDNAKGEMMLGSLVRETVKDAFDGGGLREWKAARKEAAAEAERAQKQREKERKQREEGMQIATNLFETAKATLSIEKENDAIKRANLESQEKQRQIQEQYSGLMKESHSDEQKAILEKTKALELDREKLELNQTLAELEATRQERLQTFRDAGLPLQQEVELLQRRNRYLMEGLTDDQIAREEQRLQIQRENVELLERAEGPEQRAAARATIQQKLRLQAQRERAEDVAGSPAGRNQLRINELKSDLQTLPFEALTATTVISDAFGQMAANLDFSTARTADVLDELAGVFQRTVASILASYAELAIRGLLNYLLPGLGGATGAAIGSAVGGAVGSAAASVPTGGGGNPYNNPLPVYNYNGTQLVDVKLIEQSSAAGRAYADTGAQRSLRSRRARQ